MPRVSINNDDSNLLENLRKKLKKKNKSEVIRFLLEDKSYIITDENPLDLHNLGLQVIYKSDGSEDYNEIELVDKLLKYTGLSLKDLIRFALVDYAQRQLKLATMTDKELSVSNKRGSGYIRIKKFIDAVNFHNSNVSKNEKYYISQSFVGNNSGCNRKIVKKYFAENQTIIDDINKKHQVDVTANRKGKNRKVVLYGLQEN